MSPSGDGTGVLCTLGDLLLDVVVSTRQDHWEHGGDTPSATRVGAGGQAANVASWVVALGGRARVVASLAGDLAGELVAADLRRRGVELAGPVTAGSTGVVVSVSEPGGERTMLTDRGVCPRLAAADLREDWFAGCGRLHLPVYSLVGTPIREAALAAARRVPRVSVDLSSVSALREIGVPEVARLLGLLAPDVIFGNEPESALLATAAAGQAGPAGRADPGSGATVIVKLGARGVLVDGRHWPARPARPADSTGAGDAFAAGYLLGGVEMGLDAAARAVSQLGAMP
ncbi:MAG TPA: carbohydrate kinase family protein [Streptosporangiaceae bacterium]